MSDRRRLAVVECRLRLLGSVPEDRWTAETRRKWKELVAERDRLREITSARLPFRADADE